MITRKGRKKLSGKRLRYEFPPTRHVFTVSKDKTELTTIGNQLLITRDLI